MTTDKVTEVLETVKNFSPEERKKLVEGISSLSTGEEKRENKMWRNIERGTKILFRALAIPLVPVSAVVTLFVLLVDIVVFPIEYGLYLCAKEWGWGKDSGFWFPWKINPLPLLFFIFLQLDQVIFKYIEEGKFISMSEAISEAISESPYS